MVTILRKIPTGEAIWKSSFLPQELGQILGTGETDKLSLLCSTAPSPWLLPGTQSHLLARLPHGASSLASEPNLAVEPGQGILRKVPRSHVSSTPTPHSAVGLSVDQQSNTSPACTSSQRVQERSCHCYTSTAATTAEDLCLVLVSLEEGVLN